MVVRAGALPVEQQHGGDVRVVTLWRLQAMHESSHHQNALQLPKVENALQLPEEKRFNFAAQLCAVVGG